METEANITEMADALTDHTIIEAEKGNPEYEVLLGKQCINKSKYAAEKSEKDKHGKEALDWLIKASKCGHPEANKLLSYCIEESIGIDDSNKTMVEECIHTRDMETTIRRAAASLYQELRPTPDQEFLKEAYYEKVKEFTQLKQERKFLNGTGRKLPDEKLVKRDEFIDTVTRRMRSGQIDPLQDETEMRAFTQASISRKLLKYPTTTVLLGLDAGLDWLGSDGIQLGLSALPVDQINILIAFFFLSILSINWLIKTFIGLFFYFAIFILIVCSLQMFQNKKKKSQVKAMGEMLKRYCPEIAVGNVETEFINNSMKPYWIFFMVLPLFVSTFHLMNKDWIPCSAFTCGSWSLSMVSLFLLTNYRDALSVISLLLNIISTMPYFVGVQGDSKLANAINVLVKPMFSVKLLRHFYFNVSIPAICNVIILAILVLMALRHSWKGINATLIPHMVGFFWWQIGVLFFVHSTWKGLAMSSVSWVLFVILMPFMTIAGFAYGIYYLICNLSLAFVSKVGVTLGLILIPVLLSVWQGVGFSLGGVTWTGRSGRTKMIALALIALLGTAGYTLGGEDDEDDEDSKGVMSWDLYSNMCGKEAMTSQNIAQLQLRCIPFKNIQVNWTGQVKSVQITKIENDALTFLDSLPEDMAEWFKCVFGEAYPPCDTTTLTDYDREACLLQQKYGKLCHMKKSNTYSFLIELIMQLGTDKEQLVHVKGGDAFKKVLLTLKRDRKVTIEGVLVDNIGGVNPVVNLQDITCHDCIATIEEPSKAHHKEESAQHILVRDALQTVSFFTSPLLEYDETRPKKKRKHLNQK